VGLCARAAAAVLTVLVAAPAAMGDFVIDFEGPNPFSGGTVSTAESYSSSHSLYLGGGEMETFTFDSSTGGSLSMMVFDMGKWVDGADPTTPASVYGPRWGVSSGTGDTQHVGISIIEKTFLGSGNGYGYNNANSRFGSWWSPGYYGGPRQATLGTPGTWDAGTTTWTTYDGTGMWTKWIFDITAAGVVSVYREGDTAHMQTFGTGATITQVYLYGAANTGETGGGLAGLYVDDITWTASTPEPATMGLLGIGVAGLFIRRRKR
jgi:hypothetical protein